jgi:hypothetical protein
MLLLIVTRQPQVLSSSIVAEITRAIQKTIGADIRVDLFTKLAGLLPPEQRSIVLTEALSAARSIENAAARAEALSGLIGFISIDQREAIVHEVLAMLQV